MDGLRLSDHLPQSRETALTLEELELYTGLEREQILRALRLERMDGAPIRVAACGVWVEPAPRLNCSG